MWQRLCDVLEAGCGRSVLVVGDFMLDRYTYGDAERISPEAPVPVLRVVREENALGGAGSVAADIAALGAVPRCVGILGDDAPAETVRRLLGEVGAGTDGLLGVANRPTTCKTRLIGLAQHRHRQQLIRVDDECTEPLEEASAAALIEAIERQIRSCVVVCVEDYRKGVIGERLMKGNREAARKADVPVLVDPASRDDYRLYHGMSLVTPNRTETERLLGERLPDVSSVQAAAGRILESCGTDQVCVTLDAEGAALIGPGDSFRHVPTRARDVYDVTGAGDAVLAALAVAVAGGASMADAVALANVAGGLEVERFGCVPITRDEVLGELLAEHHREHGKIRTIDRLIPELKRRRDRGETSVFTNGCFDLLHVGHVRNLAFCKAQGDVLVIGLNTDASVRRQDKAGDRPVMPQDDRASVLESLADVDYVVLFDDDTPRSLIESIVPDVLVKGRDYADKEVVGREAVERAGGRVVLAPMIEGHSTSALLERIRGVPGRPSPDPGN